MLIYLNKSENHIPQINLDVSKRELFNHWWMYPKKKKWDTGEKKSMINIISKALLEN